MSVPELDAAATIFLSHAAADTPLAEFLDQELGRALPNSNVFRTTRVDQIPAGLPWFDFITGHLRAAELYVVLLTPVSQVRPWVIFETGAAWMSKRTLVPVLGAGLQFSDVIEPLKHLQLRTLETEAQAAQAFRDLGARLIDPRAFVERAIELGRASQRIALEEEGWEQVEFNGARYAWDGPLEKLAESYGEPMADGFLDFLREKGLTPTSGEAGDLWHQYAKGYRQVWRIDERMRKHPIVTGRHVILVKAGP